MKIARRAAIMSLEVRTMDQKKTGEIIRDLRMAKKLTQAQLAETIGVSDKAVSKWDRGVSHN